MKEVKGVAKGYTKTVLKTVYKDGKQYRTKETKNYMEKIEIYGFDNLEQLKTILAHEILHLVGVGHIDTKGALMNLILQENQVKNLHLTSEDIKNFQNSF
jgi:predicted Zn-dependent protease